MILRLFRADIRKGMEQDFEKNFAAISLPFIESYAGVTSTIIAKPTKLSSQQYLMLSVWDSYVSLEAAFGANWREAHIPAGMEKYIETCNLEHLEQL